jgi:hypothetical protein
MSQNDGVNFDPVALRARLAVCDESFAAFLAAPLYPDEAAARMPGLAEWHAYRRLPPEAREPPGLTSADFASGYRNVPHPAGILDKESRGLNGRWGG